MKLSDITKTTPLVKKFAARLAKTTKQAVPIIDVQAVKRVSGASTRPAKMILENGQSVTIYIRLAGDSGTADDLDVFRVDINDKLMPMTGGDYSLSYSDSFNASVDAIAGIITQGQAAFTKKVAQASKRLKAPRAAGSAPKNKAQQRNALIAESKELDIIIADKTKRKGELELQLENLTKPAA